MLFKANSRGHYISVIGAIKSEQTALPYCRLSWRILLLDILLPLPLKTLITFPPPARNYTYIYLKLPGLVSKPIDRNTLNLGTKTANC